MLTVVALIIVLSPLWFIFKAANSGDYLLKNYAQGGLYIYLGFACVFGIAALIGLMRRT